MTNLISGKEALIALANGEEVEYWCENDPSIQKRWTPIKALNEYKLSYFLEDKPSFEFRLKPKIITLNGIEVPVPFEPKVGEKYWCFSTQTALGYGHNVYESERADRRFINMGAWRTEDEIKQVVAALRQIFGGV